MRSRYSVSERLQSMIRNEYNFPINDGKLIHAGHHHLWVRVDQSKYDDRPRCMNCAHSSLSLHEFIERISHNEVNSYETQLESKDEKEKKKNLPTPPDL